MAGELTELDRAEHNLRAQARAIDGDFLRFACALREAVGPGFDWTYFLEKPWKWAPEWVAWVAECEPSDPTSDGWDGFAAVVEGLTL